MNDPYRSSPISEGLEAAELLGADTLDWLTVIEDRSTLTTIDRLSCSRDGVWADKPIHPMGRYRALVKVGLVVVQVTSHSERVLQDRIQWVKELLSQ